MTTASPDQWFLDALSNPVVEGNLMSVSPAVPWLVLAIFIVARIWKRKKEKWTPQDYGLFFSSAAHSIRPVALFTLYGTATRSLFALVKSSVHRTF